MKREKDSQACRSRAHQHFCPKPPVKRLGLATEVFEHAAMPTVLREGPYRFFFYSSDGNEPPHIHVAKDQAIAKFWLDPVRYDYSAKFRPVEIRRIQAIIVKHRDALVDAWNEHFSD